MPSVGMTRNESRVFLCPPGKERQYLSISVIIDTSLSTSLEQNFCINQSPRVWKISACATSENISGDKQPKWKQWLNHLQKTRKWRQPGTAQSHGVWTMQSPLTLSHELTGSPNMLIHKSWRLYLQGQTARPFAGFCSACSRLRWHHSPQRTYLANPEPASGVTAPLRDADHASRRGLHLVAWPSPLIHQRSRHLRCLRKYFQGKAYITSYFLG